MCILCQLDSINSINGGHRNFEAITVEAKTAVTALDQPVAQHEPDGVIDFGTTPYTDFTPTNSPDQNINGVLVGRKWTDFELTYSFPSVISDYNSGSYPNYASHATNFSSFDAKQEAAAENWLAQYAAVSGLTFTELDGAPGALDEDQEATLRFANSTDPSTAYAYYPGYGGAAQDYYGDMWFNGAGDDPDLGEYDWHTIGHELGHALGLSHGHTSDNGYGAMNSTRDSMEFSIMTYRSYEGDPLVGGYSNAFDGYAQTLMMYDIAAIQFMYGANFGTNSGSTTYTVNTTTGEFLVNGVSQGDPVGDTIFRTVWDGNGNDTYDFSNLSTNQSINLAPGGWVDLDVGNDFGNRANLGDGNFARGHIFNALQYQGDARSLIENANGGSGDDTILGNAANNVLRGNAGDDLIKGLGGNDTLYGGTGSDTLDGGDGSDFIYGTNGVDGSGTLAGDSDTLSGGGGNDFLRGSDGNDQLDGGSGDDELRGNAGDDDLDGGTGTDEADYFYATAAVVVSLLTNTASGGDGNDTLANIENIGGSQHNDTLTGNAVSNVILGQGGDDTIIDTDFAPPADNDTYNGGAGNDTMIQSAVWSGSVVFDMTTGEQTVAGSLRDTFSNIENITVGGSAQIIGDGNDNILTGGSGNNIISGGAGNDTINGGAGNDTLNGEAGNDIINGDDGDDTIDGGTGNDTINGGNGNDTITGGSGVDTVNGGAGNDLILFTSGHFWDNVDGGTGTDTIDATLASQAGVFDFQAGTISGYGGLLTLANVEIFYGSDTQNDTIISDGTGEYYGQGGDDYMTAGLGLPETLDGGTGIDTLDTTPFSGTYTINLDTGLTNFGGELFINFENLNSGDGNDTITGTNGANIINSNGGNDTINAGLGGDTVDAGAGDDLIIDTDSISNIDAYDGGAGVDTLRHDLSWVSGVRFDLMTGEQTFSGNTYDTYANIENLEIGGDAQIIGDNNDNVLIALSLANDPNLMEGHGGNDTIEGRGGDDDIDGGSGDDFIDGGTGNDTLRGGSGVDTVLGGDGDDTIIETDGFLFETLDGGAGIDTLDYSGALLTNPNFDLAAGLATFDFSANTETILNFENLLSGNSDDSVIGTSGANIITTNGGNDDINAGSGADTVNAGDGDDTVIDTDGTTFDNYDGGAGIDTLDYSGLNFVPGVNFDMINGWVGDGVGGSFNDDTFTNFEIIIASQGHDIVISDGDGEYYGEGGDDTMFAGLTAVSEIMDGGTGVDMLDTTSFSGTYVINLMTGLTNYGGELFTNFENLTSGDGADTVTGTDFGNTIYTNGGNDIINGGLGNDQIASGLGDDQIFGEEGDDTLVGGDGNDILDGGEGNDARFGEGGNDIFNAFGIFDLFDTFDGGTGFDEIVNTAANAAIRMSNLSAAQSIEQISTTNGIPLIVSSDFDDILDFTGVTFVGINRVNTRQGNDTIIGTAGNDIINGLEGDDTIDGADGDDILIGSFGNDTVFGGNGNDLLRGNDGIDLLDGGAGNDLIVVYGTADQFDTIDGGTGTDTVRNGTINGNMAFDAFDASNNIERVNGLGQDGFAHAIQGNANANVLDFSGVQFFNVTLVNGLDGNDTIIGTDFGSDLLLGGNDDDTITGGGGNDEIRGNAGTDTAVWSGNFADYNITFGAGAYTVADTVALRDGTDTVIQTEFFEFADGTYATDAFGGLTPVPASPADHDAPAVMMIEEFDAPSVMMMDSMSVI